MRIHFYLVHDFKMSENLLDVMSVIQLDVAFHKVFVNKIG